MAYIPCPYCDCAPRSKDYAAHLAEAHTPALLREQALLTRLRDLEDLVRTLRQALQGHD